jgi:hypothetical protein
MARGNDGLPAQIWPTPRPAGQDKKHFALGTSTAKPARGYFADVVGLESEQAIWDAIEGLPDEQEITDALVKLLGSYWLARDFMKWRMGKKAAPLR